MNSAQPELVTGIEPTSANPKKTTGDTPAELVIFTYKHVIVTNQHD